MKWSVFLFSVLLSVAPGGSLHTTENPLLFPIGETLVYKVKWSFFRLGTLKMTICDTTTIDSQCVFHAKLLIDSNPVLFFVNHHAVYESFFSDKLNTYLFYSEEKIDGIQYKTRYRFNYTNSILTIDLTDMDDPTRHIQKQTPFHGRVLDGTSLLYYARFKAHQTGVDTVYYLFGGEPNPAIIHFMGRDKSVKTGAMDNPMETFYLEGDIPGKGLAGLSGRFKGWFAAHAQRPPLKAKLKVFIGHVNLELESWEKCFLESADEKEKDK